MNKIGIITLNGYHNYGNRLQNYALQQVLKKYDFIVDTLVFEKNDNKIRNSKKNTNIFSKLINIRNRSFIDTLSKINKKIFRLVYKKQIETSVKSRTLSIINFGKKYINELKFSNKTPENLIDEYDYFIVGSDQVWNPYYVHDYNLYFLSFAPKEKRISYAASFGISEIPKELECKYRRLLNEINFLSVREDAGVKIIKELTGRDIPVHIDPVLLLDKEEWLTISKESKCNLHYNFLLLYFLGDIPYRYKRQILKLAKSKKLKIINLNEVKNQVLFSSSPNDFINYISKCTILCTDSFHGAVFSIIFEKPFIIYERLGDASMYSRISTILDKFNLNSRKSENIKTMNDAFNVDYSHVKPILEKEKEKAYNYLKVALKVEQRNNL